MKIYGRLVEMDRLCLVELRRLGKPIKTPRVVREKEATYVDTKKTIFALWLDFESATLEVWLSEEELEKLLYTLVREAPTTMVLDVAGDIIREAIEKEVEEQDD